MGFGAAAGSLSRSRHDEQFDDDQRDRQLEREQWNQDELPADRLPIDGHRCQNPDLNVVIVLASEVRAGPYSASAIRAANSSADIDFDYRADDDIACYREAETMANRKSLHCDVCIVGADLSGLHAALLLAKRGVDVLVLEAADRVGGRLLTEHGEDGLFIDQPRPARSTLRTWRVPSRHDQRLAC